MSSSTEIPAPLPSQSAIDNDSHPLSERINTATRPIHTYLNRVILSRLPLALPPNTNDPSIYTTALLHITPIYSTFESAWATLLESPSNLHPRLRPLLLSLYAPGLIRHGVLQTDIEILSQTPSPQIEAQFLAISTRAPLSKSLAHIRNSINEKPHVIIAYTWVLYMALFSGGRILRGVLKSAPSDFWETNAIPITKTSKSNSSHEPIPLLEKHLLRPDTTPPIPGLGFFHFETENDGEDLKIKYKELVSAAEDILTDQEKNDIVLEAEAIFGVMVDIIGQLDELCGTPELDSKAKGRNRASDRFFTFDYWLDCWDGVLDRVEKRFVKFGVGVGGSCRVEKGKEVGTKERVKGRDPVKVILTTIVAMAVFGTWYGMHHGFWY